MVAVSGGLDSMVLLYLLSELADGQRWRLTVAHFNHQLRGRSSDADERLVRHTAQRLKLPCVVERGDVLAFAGNNKLSVEMAARHLRHAFLARAAKRRKIPTVALAHHADDQLELFFLRLFRGSGGEGLSGMKWIGRSPASRAVKLVRPLLEQSKKGLQDFAKSHHVPFREDATNSVLDIQRNRIRHELLPLLRKHYQPALDKTIGRVIDIIGAESEFVSHLAKEWHTKRLAWPSLNPGMPFSGLPVALQRQCIRIQLVTLGFVPDYDLVERLRLAPTKRVALTTPCPVWLAMDSRGTLQKISETKPLSRGRTLKITLAEAGEVETSGVRLRWRVRALKGEKRPKAVVGTEFFDADRVGQAILVRHWQAGDRFQPIGMTQAVKLQDFFTNQKVPRERRHQLLLGLTAQGEVFWVEGMRIAERFKLRKRTNRRLQWHYQRL